MTTGALSSDGGVVGAGGSWGEPVDSWGESVDLTLLTNPVAAPAGRGVAPWKVMATTDTLVGLIVMVAASVAASHITGPAHRGLADNALFVGVTWGSLLVAIVGKRLYVQARRRLATVTSSTLAPLVEALVTATLVVLAADALAGNALRRAVPPGMVVLAFAACALLMPAARSLAVAAQAHRGRISTRVVVVGTGTVASDIAARLSRNSQIELVGFVDDDPADDAAVLGGLDSLCDICEQHDVNRVVVAFSRSGPADATPYLRRLGERVAIDVVPRYFELTGWGATVSDLSGLPVISLHDGPAHSLERRAKRLVDVVVSVFGLILTAPLMLALALAVKLSSPGPVFFTQTRLGRDRAPFRIIKLRTMEVAHEPELDLIPDGGAPRRPGTIDQARVTSVGRFLRRSGLDEIPQLLNVLRGQMSLVGPRPFVLAECDGLPEWSDPRFDVRPGLTGLWQVCGQHHLRFEELCRLDVLYVARWSFGSDLRILARTPGRLLRGGGGAGAVAD